MSESTTSQKESAYNQALTNFIQSYESYLGKIKDYDFSYTEITGSNYLSNLIAITKEVSKDTCQKKCDSVQHCVGYSFDPTAKNCRIYSGQTNDTSDGQTQYKRNEYNMISAWNDVISKKAAVLIALDNLKTAKTADGATYTLDELYAQINNPDEKIAEVVEIESKIKSVRETRESTRKDFERNNARYVLLTIFSGIALYSIFHISQKLGS